MKRLQSTKSDLKESIQLDLKACHLYLMIAIDHLTRRFSAKHWGGRQTPFVRQLGGGVMNIDSDLIFLSRNLSRISRREIEQSSLRGRQG